MGAGSAPDCLLPPSEPLPSRRPRQRAAGRQRPTSTSALLPRFSSACVPPIYCLHRELLQEAVGRTYHHQLGGGTIPREPALDRLELCIGSNAHLQDLPVQHPLASLPLTKLTTEQSLPATPAPGRSRQTGAAAWGEDRLLQRKAFTWVNMNQGCWARPAWEGRTSLSAKVGIMPTVGP